MIGYRGEYQLERFENTKVDFPPSSSFEISEEGRSKLAPRWSAAAAEGRPTPT